MLSRSSSLSSSGSEVDLEEKDHTVEQLLVEGEAVDTDELLSEYLVQVVFLY